MIETQFGKKTIVCDRCDEELGLFVREEDFFGMIQEAKSRGWAIRQEHARWAHYCPDCKGRSALDQQRKLLGL